MSSFHTKQADLLPHRPVGLKPTVPGTATSSLAPVRACAVPDWRRDLPAALGCAKQTMTPHPPLQNALRGTTWLANTMGVGVVSVARRERFSHVHKHFAGI